MKNPGFLYMKPLRCRFGDNDISVFTDDVDGMAGLEVEIPQPFAADLDNWKECIVPNPEIEFSIANGESSRLCGCVLA
jgi:hypothetical protein